MRYIRPIFIFIFLLFIVFIITGCRNTLNKDSLVAFWDFNTIIKVYNGELIVEKNAFDIDFSNWDHIKSVSSDGLYLGGIRENGTAVVTYFTGDDLDVSNWDDISMLEFTIFSAYGLKNDGTIISSTMNTENENEIDKKVSSWTDIAWIDTDYTGIVGVKKDGTVLVALDYFTDSADKKLKRKLSKWTNIRMAEISGSLDRIRVVGLNNNGEILEAQFEDIRKYQLDSCISLNGAVKICAGDIFTAGLMPDGTLRVVCGDDYESIIAGNSGEIEYYDLLTLDNTKDVLDINSSGDMLIVLKKNGTVLMGGIAYLD